MKTRKSGAMDVSTLYQKLKAGGDQFNTVVFDSAQKEEQGTFQKETADDRFFQIKQDEGGNAFVTLRFLPSVSETGVITGENYLLHARHYFDVGGKNWFIMNCPWVMGKQECPICKENRDLWEANKTLYGIRKAKRMYIYNVYIVKDAVEPSNNGKVFLWSVPVQIHNMIHETISPKNKLRDPRNVFGLDAPVFTLDVKVKTININGKSTTVKDYDKSKFSDNNYPLADSEEKAMEILSHITDVNSLLKEDKYHVSTTAEFTEKYELKKIKAGRHLIDINSNFDATPADKPHSVVQKASVKDIPNVKEVLVDNGDDDVEEIEDSPKKDDSFSIEDFKF